VDSGGAGRDASSDVWVDHGDWDRRGARGGETGVSEVGRSAVWIDHGGD
jgi:hypothetical protein